MYLAKHENIGDQAMRQVNVTEKFLPTQQLLDNNTCVVFRLDRQRSTNEDVTKGEIMIACRINIPHPWLLNV